MKQRSNLRQAFAMLIILALLLASLPTNILAVAGNPKGTKVNGDTNLLKGSFNPDSTINLPIEIYDYPADGMLFEYSSQAQARAQNKKIADFWGWGEDFANMDHPNTSSWYRTEGNNTVAVSEDISTPGCHYLHADWRGNCDINAVPGSLGHAFWHSKTLGTWSYSDLKDIRYVVMVYRSNVKSGSMMLSLGREKKNGNHLGSTKENCAAEVPFTQGGATGEGTEKRWTYMVFDMKTGGLGETWNADYGKAHQIYMATPMTKAGQWMEIAYLTYFRTSKDAQQFGEYAISGNTPRGANLGYGLLFPNKDTNGNNSGNCAADSCRTVVQVKKDTQNDRNLNAVSKGIGYNLYGRYGKNGWATMGLLESGLQDGLPRYKAEVVNYLAAQLAKTLTLKENPDGWTNYMDPRGEPLERYGGVDLPTALTRLGLQNNGSAAAAAGKNLIGTWEECKNNIKTYHDAAYFLLNNLFVPNSYNAPQHDYDYLTLSRAKAPDGTNVYVFDGGFGDSADANKAKSAVAYGDTIQDGVNSRTIRNTSAAGKPMFHYNSTAVTTLFPFLPVTSGNNGKGQTISPYAFDDAVLGRTTEQDTYVNRDFNYVLKSSGEFVYHAEDDLFFQFEGDDDVYLFVNGELVLDLGGAHAISSEAIRINEYVSEAWKNVNNGNPTERDKKLALIDGNTYDFDFFYMERHGYGANMRIVTNIRVTDPNMTTVKSAYQDGQEISYGGIVDQKKPVEYSFKMLNKGNTNLNNLSFNDQDIGIRLDSVNGLTVTGQTVCDLKGEKLDVTDLVAYVDEGSSPMETVEVTFADNEALKAFLKDLTTDGTQGSDKSGLCPGSTVTFRGIGYKLTEEQIKAAVFDNTVQTTAQSNETILHGSDSHRIFVPSDPMYYQWAGTDLVIEKEKLVADVLKAANNPNNTLHDKIPGLSSNNVKSMQLTTAMGYETVNQYVAVTNDNIKVSYNQPGSRVFYVKISYGNHEKPVIVPVLVNSTAVKDSVFVLDYGLGVDLTQNGELFKNDYLTISGRTTKSRLEGLSNVQPSYVPNNITFTADSSNSITGKYGAFTLKDDILNYGLTEFLEGDDQIWVAVRVGESDYTTANSIGTVDINNEVEMYKSVTVLPANVVYYEDDFPAIKYNENSGNVIESTGTSIGIKQEADQSQEYGKDKAYQANSDRSAGSLHTIQIKETSVVASFQFTGTGFELIGRTNAKDSSTLIITVKSSDGEIVKRFPVITEFDHNADGGSEEIYQVPVVRVDDLARGQYTVEISGVPSRTGKDIYLYLDGIRIYQPIDPGDERYNETEKNARFVEIRDQIVNGVAAATKLEGNNLTFSTGTTTWVENRNGNYESNQTGSANDYLLAGPNNEVYMNGALDRSALVFYVKETGNGAHSLQIAMRGIDTGLFYGTASTGVKTPVYYGAYQDGKFVWRPLVTVRSSTEQYYTIPYRDCFKDNEGRYQIIIKSGLIDGVKDDGATGMISYSSIKMTGLELSTLNGEKASMHYENGVLVDNETSQPVPAANVMNFEAIGHQMRSVTIAPGATGSEVIEPEETEPEETESEGTEPEETEPEETEPEETEPEETEPEETEPEETESEETESDEDEEDFYSAIKEHIVDWIRGWFKRFF